MADRPAAEVHVDVPLVRRLLAAQCPEIDGVGRTADLSLEIVGEGWDNVMLRLGTSLAVRVPRRDLSARLVVHEQQWLAEIARRVDVLVPAPVVVGTPTDEYPWHWSVVPWVQGVAAGSVDRARLRGVAAPLATFFNQLRTPAPPDAPVNTVRGGPLASRDAVVRDRLALLDHPRRDELARAWDVALAAPVWEGPALWLHGDPHAYNIVVSDEDLASEEDVVSDEDVVSGEFVVSDEDLASEDPAADVTLRAVVDFGDMTSGDPAGDLAAAWLIFDLAGRRTFRDTVDAAAAGSAVLLDPAVWERARGWALVLATALLAHSDDAPDLAAAGRQTVDALLDDV